MSAAPSAPPMRSEQLVIAERALHNGLVAMGFDFNQASAVLAFDVFGSVHGAGCPDRVSVVWRRSQLEFGLHFGPACRRGSVVLSLRLQRRQDGRHEGLWEHAEVGSLSEAPALLRSVEKKDWFLAVCALPEYRARIVETHLRSDRDPNDMAPCADVTTHVQLAFHPGGGVAEEVEMQGLSTTGLWRTWYPSGQSSGEWNVVKGVYEGVSRTWFENGQLQFERCYSEGVPTRERWFSPSGKRVLSPMDKWNRQLRTALMKALTTARAAAAKAEAASTAGGRKPKAGTSAEPDHFIEDLLKQAWCDAFAWLDVTGTQEVCQLGEMDCETSLELVRVLRELGAAGVRAIGVVPEDPVPSTNTLLVELPEADPVARRGLFAFERAWARRGGFEGQKDVGQRYLFIGAKM